MIRYDIRHTEPHDVPRSKHNLYLYHDRMWTDAIQYVEPNDSSHTLYPNLLKHERALGLDHNQFDDTNNSPLAQDCIEPCFLQHGKPGTSQFCEHPTVKTASNYGQRFERLPAKNLFRGIAYIHPQGLLGEHPNDRRYTLHHVEIDAFLLRYYQDDRRYMAGLGGFPREENS